MSPIVGDLILYCQDGRRQDATTMPIKPRMMYKNNNMEISRKYIDTEKTERYKVRLVKEK
jgi:hypothetical protein